MKRKIVNMGTIGIVVIILLVGVLNYKQAAETEMKKIETEENSVRENKQIIHTNRTAATYVS